MRKLLLHVCLLAALATALFSCKKDQNATTVPTTLEPVNEQQVRQDIQKALLEIQKAQGVDMAVQLRMVAQFIVVPNNFYGIVLCHIAPNSLKMPDGRLTGAELSANAWKISSNQANSSINVGYLVINGANGNSLDGNSATANGFYDIELVGQTSRIGFPRPLCFNNRVTAGSGQKVKDCGNKTLSRAVLCGYSLQKYGRCEYSDGCKGWGDGE